MDEVFASQNLVTALKRVERNRGAAGVDGVETHELRDWCRQHWVTTRAALDAGTYRPSPVRQVMIPNLMAGNGNWYHGAGSVDPAGYRASTVPGVRSGFVPVSYGFRPGKSAHDAVKVARLVIEQGYRWVVEVDLDAFFDRVNHDILISRLRGR